MRVSHDAAATGLRETLPPQRRQAGGMGATLTTFRGLLGDRAFVGYALSCGLAFAAMFSYILGSSFVLQDIYGVSPQLFSVLFGLNALGLVAMGQVNGWLVGRVSPRRLPRLGLRATALGGLALLAIVAGGVGLVFVVVASLGTLSMAAVIAVLRCRALAAYTLLADADHLPRAEGAGVDAP